MIALAQPLALLASDDEELLLVYALVMLGVCFVSLVVQAVVCWLVAGYYRAIPEKHRAMKPATVWFNLIPLVPLVFNFWVFPGLADSFQRAFRDRPPGEDVGDCGRNLALWYCIAAACSIVPCVNYIAAPAALVLLVLVLVKANQLKLLLVASAEDPGWG